SHLTLSGNTAAAGGAIGTGPTGPHVHFWILNSIFTHSSGHNCAGTLADSYGGNLDDDRSCGSSAGAVSGKDPLLGPLRDNGGPTATMALQSGSPAIDIGLDDEDQHTFPAGAALLYDQRGPGFSRKAGAHVDAGAYERAVCSGRFALCDL